MTKGKRRGIAKPWHLNRPRVERLCERCGKSFAARLDAVKAGAGRFCSRRCASSGYRVPTPKFYRGGPNGKRAHVVIAERALGHELPKGACVHHVNEDKVDNRPQNLMICQDGAYHRLLHLRADVLRRGGDPNTERICCTCQQPCALLDMGRRLTGRRTLTSQCRACQRAATRAFHQRTKRAFEHRIQAPLPAGAVIGILRGRQVVCQSKAYRNILQARARIVRAGGNPNTDRICSQCRLVRHRSQFAPTSCRCHPCEAARVRAWKHRQAVTCVA